MQAYLSLLALSAALASAVAATRLVLRPTAPSAAESIDREQDDCPSIEAFALTDPWSVSLGRLPPEQVWPRVRQAIEAWRVKNFPEDTSSLPALVLEREASIQQQATPLDAYRARTCFFRKRLPPRVEYRLALAFAIKDAARARGVTTLEVRWLSGLRGGGEKKWMIDRERGGPLVEDLVRRLTQGT